MHFLSSRTQTSATLSHWDIVRLSDCLLHLTQCQGLCTNIQFIFKKYKIMMTEMCYTRRSIYLSNEFLNDLITPLNPINIGARCIE